MVEEGRVEETEGLLLVDEKLPTVSLWSRPGDLKSGVGDTLKQVAFGASPPFHSGSYLFAVLCWSELGDSTAIANGSQLLDFMPDLAL